MVPDQRERYRVGKKMPDFITCFANKFHTKIIFFICYTLEINCFYLLISHFENFST